MTEIEVNKKSENYAPDQDKKTNDEMAIIIDGHNIKDLGLHTLRGGISIIP